VHLGWRYPEGFKRTASHNETTTSYVTGQHHLGGLLGGIQSSNDADQHRIVESWLSLPGLVRVAIAAMIDTVVRSDGEA